MLYTVFCKQHRHEEKRFWFCQERHFVMPVSEGMQNMQLS